MSVRKICNQKGCRASPRCDHPWWFDVMHDGKRWRMRVDDFALVRGASEPVTSKQTAERIWEPKFVAEIAAGRDPRIAPAKAAQPEPLTVGEFLDRYYVSYVEAEALRSASTIKGRLNAVKKVVGDLPVAVLEKPAEIMRFKASFRQGHEIATVNRALGSLRAAINWGRFQDPPIVSTTPFHRFGVTIRTKEETRRDRRLATDEGQKLLTAALDMNCNEHKFVGSSMHDRLIGALETCCRQGEMLRIQNRHVDWERHQIAIPGANAKDAENRRIPFDPQGRLTPILKRRARLGSSAFVFGAETGEFQASFKTAWEALLLVANGHDTKRIRPGTWTDRDREKLRQIDLHWHDLRTKAPVVCSRMASTSGPSS